MGIVSFITLILNIALLVAVDVFAFAAGTFYGVAALIGSAAFFIAYMVSVEVTVAPRDFWVNPSFDVMKKKLKFAWGCAFVTGVFSFLVIVAIYG